MFFYQRFLNVNMWATEYDRSFRVLTLPVAARIAYLAQKMNQRDRLQK